MKKLKFLFKFIILIITMIECFKTPSFAMLFPQEIIDQISYELIIAYQKDDLKTVKSQKSMLRQNVMKLMFVSRNFYQSILDAICNIPDCWDYFEVTIDESSTNRKFNQVMSRCDEYLKKDRILPPLFVSICFNEVTFGPRHIHQLEKNLAPFLTHIKRLRFVGVRIFQKTSVLSFQNALAKFSRLIAIDAKGKSMMTIWGVIPIFDDIHIHEKLLLSLEEFSPLHHRLQNLTLNFNCQKYRVQKLIIFEANDSYANVFIDTDRLVNMILKFSNLKKIGLISADLQLEDHSKLEKILSQFSEKIEDLDFSENDISNEFLEKIFSRPNYNALKVLNISKTQINQDCRIYAKFKNLSRLIMRECSNLEPTILEKLSQFGNLVNKLEELDISGSNLRLKDVSKDLSKFKKLELIYQ